MTDFYINDNVTLSNNDGAWSLLLNGEASDLEGFLEENVHPEIEEALSLPEAPEECKDIVEEFYPEAIKA